MTDKEIEVIVKPIFIKMFNSNFSACEYGIECYKKGMEYQGIKELAIENDNLIKGVERLEEQIADTKEYCCKVSKFLHDNSNARPDTSVYKKRDILLINELKLCEKWGDLR